MGCLHDDWNEFGLQGAINLDLNVAKIGILVDGCLGLLRRIRVQTRRRLEGSTPINETRFPDARTYRSSVIPLELEMVQLLGVVSHIANAGYSARNIQQAIHRLDVSMHIKEAGQQSLTPAIDVLCVARNLGIRRWTNCCYGSPLITTV